MGLMQWLTARAGYDASPRQYPRIAAPKRRRTHGVGWCVPVAVARLTGQTPEEVWLRILEDRRTRGRSLTMVKGAPLDDPLRAGGAHAAEALRVLKAAGMQLVDAWRGTRRMTYAEFLSFATRYEREHGATEWLVLQQTHLAYVPGDWTWAETGTLVPGLPIAKAWAVYSKYDRIPSQETTHGRT